MIWSKILNHISKRNYNKLNKRLDDFFYTYSKNFKAEVKRIEKDAQEQVSMHLASMKSVDLNALLKLKDTVSIIEADIIFLKASLNKKKSKK